jgi:hypothetical protein
MGHSLLRKCPPPLTREMKRDEAAVRQRGKKEKKNRLENHAI